MGGGHSKLQEPSKQMLGSCIHFYENQQTGCRIWYVSGKRIENKFRTVAWDQVVKSLKSLRNLDLVLVSRQRLWLMTDKSGFKKKMQITIKQGNLAILE